jgi:uncharacterized protein (DUF362 family)
MHNGKNGGGHRPSPDDVDRRSFLIRALCASSLALIAPAAVRPGDLFAATKTGTLSIGKGTNYKNAVIDAVGGLGGISAFISGGERVVVKPNIGWDSPPQYGGDTHPLVVRTIVEMCLSAGAAKVLVFDNPCDDARRTYATSGIKAAVEGLKNPKAKVEYIDDNKWVAKKIPHAKKLTEWTFYREALDADKLINVPVAKNHGSTTLTLSMKNLMGVIGGNRGQIHWGIDQKLADISSFIRPALIVLDATRVMLDGGPSGGDLGSVRVTNRVIAGVDPVAVDSYGATLFGMKGTDIGHIVRAAEMGLGQIDLSKVKIIGA